MDKSPQETDVPAKVRGVRWERRTFSGIVLCWVAGKFESLGFGKTREGGRGKEGGLEILSLFASAMHNL